MNRSDVTELHFIAPIENVPSILTHGLLCHNLAKDLPHQRIDDWEVQANRINKAVPGTNKKLHDFANLYFDAHNPMLSRRRNENNTICVLRFAATVIDLPDVIVTDRNAAKDWARFYPTENGLSMLNAERIFAADWRDPDQYVYWDKKGAKCAEVLVPDKVEPHYIFGAYVANQTAMIAFQMTSDLNVELKTDMFF